MQCNRPGCKGKIEDGVCSSCKQKADLEASPSSKPASAPIPKVDPPTAKVDPAPAKVDPPTPAKPEPTTAAKPDPKSFPTENADLQVREELKATVSFEYDKRKSAPQNLKRISARLQALDDHSEKGKEELMRAASVLETVRPDKFEAWRAQADLWLAAIRQLEKRQLGPDDNVVLLGVPLRENKLRDAAEKALRQCAHLSNSIEQRITLVDEANSVRRMTWF